MPEINDVVLGETIATEWGNAIRDRTIQRYANVADRNAEHPNPSAGDLAYLADTGAVEVYHSGAWQPFLPVGVVVPFAGATAPTGWLFCHGQAVSRTTYASLFALIGTTYGAGNGSSTFNLPDLRQRFILGKAVSGTGDTLGETGGQINHTHTQGNTGPGNAGNTGPAGSHTHSNPVTGEQIEPATAAVREVSSPPFIGVSLSGHEHPQGNTGSAGSHTHSVPGHQHSNPETNGKNPPYIVLNHIIKAL